MTNESVTDGGPNFIGIGVQRASTSWLYHCLDEHPQTFLPRKEVHFFDRNYDRGLGWYRGIFADTPRDALAGEFTPDYIDSRIAVDRIYDAFPDAKLVVLLRNPWERAYSAYKLHQSHGELLSVGFAEACRKMPHLISKGMYNEQLQFLFSKFDRSQVFVRLQDDVVQDAAGLFRDLCDFLEIDSGFEPPSLKSVRNSSAFTGVQSRFGLPEIQKTLAGSPFAPLLRRLKSTAIVNSLKRYLMSKEASVEPHTQLPDSLNQELFEDVKNLEITLDIDLSSWLRYPQAH